VVIGRLMAAAILQAVIVYYSGSVALLADTIHNVDDALTAIPLWLAFRMSTWKRRSASPKGTDGWRIWRASPLCSPFF